MLTVYVGLLLALLGTTSMSITMNLWKASSVVEADLPWYQRKRFLLGVMMGIGNTVLDGVAFSLTPLSLIAPMQGLTIAMTVCFAALGFGGHRESVSALQWQAIAGTIVGLVICSWYGPTSEAERAWWPLIRHYFEPKWQCYLVLSCARAAAPNLEPSSVISFSTLTAHRSGVLHWPCTDSIALVVVATQRVPALSCLVPRKGTLAFTLATCIVSGMLAGLCQTQLKVLAQAVRAVLEAKPKIACHEAPPGFCLYQVSQCPSLWDAGGLDIICHPLVTLGGKTLPAYPNTWLFNLNGWGILPSVLLQLNMMTTGECHVAACTHPVHVISRSYLRSWLLSSLL